MAARDESMSDTPRDASRDAPRDATGKHRAQAESARRRSVDHVFGDVLPDSVDDQPSGEGDDRRRDDDYLRDVPPHHG